MRISDWSSDGCSSELLLTQEEAARALGKSIKTIYRMRNSGQLAYIPGSPVTIPERALVQYLEGATICRDKTRGRTSRKSQTSTDTLKSCGQTQEPDALSIILRVKERRRRRKSISRSGS